MLIKQSEKGHLYRCYCAGCQLVLTIRLLYCAPGWGLFLHALLLDILRPQCLVRATALFWLDIACGSTEKV